MRAEYFGFAVNEYRYRRVHFTRHRSQEAAEKRHTPRFQQGIDPVSADLSVTVIEGRDAFVKWAAECNYRIDWKAGVLIHADPEADALEGEL